MPLYDQYGYAIDLKALREEQAAPEIMGVRRAVSEQASFGLTPTRLGQLLRDCVDGDPAPYMALAEEMEEKDLHYLSVLGTRKRAVSQLEITVDPADDSAEAARDAQLVRDFVESDVLQPALFDILDAVGKGISVSEIMWETSEKDWMPKSIEWVDPRFLEFDRVDRRTPLLKSIEGPQALAPYKFIRCTIQAKSGLPIRSGLARPIAWAYLFKQFDIKGWVQFAEAYGMPLRLGKYGSGATPEDRRTLLRAVANIGQDAAAIIPESMLIEFPEVSKQGNVDFFERLAEFMERQQSKAVLGQTTTTDAISGGHAVGKEHNDVRGDIEAADCSQLSGILKRDIVRPIVDLNHGPRKRYPLFKIGRAEQIDQKAFAENVERLAGVGLPIKVDDVYSKMGLTKPNEGDDILNPKGAAPRPEDDETEDEPESEEVPGSEDDDAEDDDAEDEAGQQATAQQSAITAAAGREPKDAIEGLIQGLIDDGELEAAFEPVLSGVEALVASAENYEDLAAKLAEGINGMGVDALADTLARSTFVGRLAGDADVDLGDDEGG
ncbi:MAG: DUF935 domain-containing protein [Magnetovibrionaceae bacterium]